MVPQHNENQITATSACSYDQINYFLFTTTILVRCQRPYASNFSFCNTGTQTYLSLSEVCHWQFHIFTEVYSLIWLDVAWTFVSNDFQYDFFFKFLPHNATQTARLCHSTSSLRLSVCPSVTSRYRHHTGWNTSKIISRLNSLSTCSDWPIHRWSGPTGTPQNRVE